MGKHNRIEFNDFGDSKKNSDRDIYDDFLGGDNIDDWDAESDIVIKGETPRYRKTGAKSGLYTEDFGEDFADDFDDDFYGNTDSHNDKHRVDTTDDSFAASESYSENTSNDVPSEGPVLANFDDDDDDMFNPKNKKKKGDDGKKIMLIASVSIGLVVVLIVALFISVISIANQKTIYEGITLNGSDLGGMTQIEAEEYITKMYIDPIKNADITIELNGKEYVYPMSDFVLCPDSKSIAAEAYNLHRDEKLFKRFAGILKLKKDNHAFGLTYNITPEKLNEIMESAEDVSFKDPVNPSYTVKKESVTFTPGKKGTAIDKNKFEQKLYEALSEFEKEMESLGTGESLKNVKIVAEVTEVDFKHLDARAIYNETYKPAKNPTFYAIKDQNGRVVDIGYNDVVHGHQLDMNALTYIVGNINAGQSDVYSELKFQPSYADFSVSDLDKMIFRDELASSTTVNSFDENDAKTLEDQANRDNNFSIMAPKLNGTIIMPGDRFSFNEIIGKVSSSNGYVFARENTASTANIMGGGVSQAATTIYVAALKSGLSVVEHKNNEYLPYYGTPGLDAYVNLSSGTTLAFINNTNYPIKINFNYDGSSLSVSIYGTDDGGIKNYTVKSESLGTTVDGEYTIYKYKASRSSSSLTEDLGEISYKGEANYAPNVTETPDNSESPTESIEPTEGVTEEPTDAPPTATDGEPTNTASPTETNQTETPSETPSATPTVEPSATPTENPVPTEEQNGGRPARPERPER